MWTHPALTPGRGCYSIFPPQKDGRLSWHMWRVAYRDGLPFHRRSPIQVLTQKCMAGRFNSWPVDHKSNALTTTLPSHQLGKLVVCCFHVTSGYPRENVYTSRPNNWSSDSEDSWGSNSSWEGQDAWICSARWEIWGCCSFLFLFFILQFQLLPYLAKDKYYSVMIVSDANMNWWQLTMLWTVSNGLLG